MSVVEKPSNINYYSLQFKTGLFYRSVKEPLEGYVEKRYKDKTGTEQVRYHKHFEAIKGFIDYAVVKDTPFGKQLTLGVTDGNIKSGINIPLKDKYGRYSSELCSILHVVENVDLSKSVTISFNTKDSEYNGKTYTNIYCNIVQEGDTKSVPSFDLTTIPKAKKTKNSRDEVVYDSEDRLDFYFEKLNSFLERVSASSKVSNNAPSTSSTPSTIAPKDEGGLGSSSIENVPTSLDDDDDLPF